jgi:phenylalanyl-tRNA synthetase alpha chain
MTSPDLQELEQRFSERLSHVRTADQLEALRLEYLGKKSVLSALMESLKTLPPETRQKTGQDLNRLKETILTGIVERKSAFERQALEETLKKDRRDWTLPSYPFPAGKLHPLTQVMEEIVDIFAGLGFQVAEGPEIETDENNFGALNIPDDHPAKDMHDTFYVKKPAGAASEPLLLRTHTSPIQIRTMKALKPPLRVIAPGRVYRHEAIDATHSYVFHQVEGFVVDKNISFADLKGTLEIFNRRFFGPKVETRFHPSFFPFVEPGAQVMISCTLCRADGSNARPGCAVCRGSGWLEMLGAGMIHPNVFKSVGYDPETYTGFAFGMGVERVAIMRYGVPDMRLFFENHLDFLSQF